MQLPKLSGPELPENLKTLNEKGIPMLLPIKVPEFRGKLWENNVNSTLEKVSNNEMVTRSDGELLRNRLKFLQLKFADHKQANID